MAGRLIPIVGKQTFSMALPSSGSPPTVILGSRCYDVREAVSGVLMVRAASLSITSGAGNFDVNLVNAIVMPDDPATIYTGTLGTTPHIQVRTGDALPQLYIYGFTTSTNPPCGPMVAVQLIGNYTSGTDPVATITLAVDLLIRDT